MDQPQPSTVPVEAAPVIDPAPSAPGSIQAWLPEPQTPTAGGLNPRTGEPQRPGVIILATLTSLAAVAAQIAALLWTYWNAVENYDTAAWLFAQFSELSTLARVGLVAAVTTTTLIAAAAASITGFYAWWGYSWTKIAGIVAAATSLLALLLNPVGWAAIPLTLAAAILLWLPGATVFFEAWQRHRHPDPAFRPPVESVWYGPLPKYRR